MTQCAQRAKSCSQVESFNVVCLFIALTLPVLNLVNQLTGHTSRISERDGEPFVDLVRGISVLLCWLTMLSRLMWKNIDLPKLVRVPAPRVLRALSTHS